MAKWMGLARGNHFPLSEACLARFDPAREITWRAAGSLGPRKLLMAGREAARSFHCLADTGADRLGDTRGSVLLILKGRVWAGGQRQGPHRCEAVEDQCGDPFVRTAHQDAAFHYGLTDKQNHT